MAFDDPLVVIVLAVFAGNVLVHVVYPICTLVVFVLCKTLGMHDIENLLYPKLPLFLFPIVQYIVTFTATMIWAISSVFFKVRTAKCGCT